MLFKSTTFLYKWFIHTTYIESFPKNEIKIQLEAKGDTIGNNRSKDGKFWLENIGTAEARQLQNNNQQDNSYRSWDRERAIAVLLFSQRQG